MLKRYAIILLALAMLAAPSLASAQDFGRSGTLGFSADRLFGLSIGERNIEQGPNDIDLDFTLFGLGWQSSFIMPVNVPRFAIDYFVIDGLSIGGTLGFYVGEYDPGSDAGTGFILSPRVGYFFDFASWVGLWLRGGLTFYTIDDIPTDQNQLLLNLEAMFVFFPADSWGILLGPTADVGLIGEFADNDMMEWSIGVQFGMIGFLNL